MLSGKSLFNTKGCPRSINLFQAMGPFCARFLYKILIWQVVSKINGGYMVEPPQCYPQEAWNRSHARWFPSHHWWNTQSSMRMYTPSGVVHISVAYAILDLTAWKNKKNEKRGNIGVEGEKRSFCSLSTPPIVRKLSVTFLNPTNTTIQSMLIKCASYLLCRWMFWFWITCILSIRVWNLYCRNCAPQILSHYTLGLSTCSSWMSSHHFHLYVPNVEWEFMLSLYVPCAVPNPLNFIYFQSKAAPWTCRDFHIRFSAINTSCSWHLYYY